MSEINEKNALITDRKNACIKTKKQKNKCGCNITKMPQVGIFFNRTNLNFGL